MTFSTMANATSIINSNQQTKNYIETIKQIEEKVTDKYIEYRGEVSDILMEDNNHFEITVENGNNNSPKEIVFNTTMHTMIIDAATGEVFNLNNLKESDSVTAYYNENNPMTMSLPPQTGADVIVINREGINSKLSYFNSQLIDANNELKLNMPENSKLVGSDNNILDNKHLENKNLLIFYSISTMSIPAQTTPDRIIIIDPLEENEEIIDEKTEDIGFIPSLKGVVIDGRAIELEGNIYKSNNIHMIPLRQIAEELGYDVLWNNDEQSVELRKDTQWTKVTIGEDNYNFAKMLVKLGKAPEITNFKTYVPVSFLEEVLNLKIEISEGILEIK